MDVDQSLESGEPADHSLEDVNSVFTRWIDAVGDNAPYEATRKTLLDEEKAKGWTAAAFARASDKEKLAETIVRYIRERERSGDPFGNMAAEAQPPHDSHDMGGRFLMERKRIATSDIFDIACMAPKGAHLHLHLNSELPPEDLFAYARKPEVQNTMFIRSTLRLLNDDAFRKTEIVLSILPQDTPTGNLFAADYEPDWKAPGQHAWMPWAEFCKTFDTVATEHLKPEEVPKITDPNDGEVKLMNRAECWAREKMMITQDLKYKRATTHNFMWACFNEGTRAFKGLLNYEGVFTWYIGHAIDNMIKQKVMYAELRPMLMDKSIPSDDGTRMLSHSDQMRIILKEVAAKQQSLDADGELRKFPFGLRIIYCAPRSIPKTRMRTELGDCLKLAMEFKDYGLIVGFDLVGAEDRPNNIGFYADLLRSFQNTCEQLGLNVPFMFHAGETLLDMGGSRDPDKSNLYDSYLLHAKRIGHGYSILKHPLLIEKYKEANIALELCPISNELLGLCGNAREHPFPALLAAGLHCTLNADNPSLFNSSMSHEFYQVMVGDTRMTLHGWRQLAEWSIEHSRLSKADKKKGLEILREDWEDFSDWVIRKYGHVLKE